MLSALDRGKGARRLRGWVGAEQGFTAFVLVWGEEILGTRIVVRVAFGHLGYPHAGSKGSISGGTDNVFLCLYFFFVILATQKGRSHFTVYTLNNINGICRSFIPSPLS